MQLPFTKMHGLGNDFVVLNLIAYPVKLRPALIRRLADRHRGIGFDQLLLVEPPTDPDVDFNYRIFNADGSEVEHCGNGARCFARYVLDKGLIARPPIRVKTVNRLLTLQVTRSGEVSVDMGIPDFAPAALPFDADSQQPVYSLPVEADGVVHSAAFSAVSVGNPHIVLEVDDVDTAAVASLGPALASHPAFARGVNVGFMQIIDRQNIRLRVYERGAGETSACGTGACAAVVCGINNGRLDPRVQAGLKGGNLLIHWSGPGESIIMTGPATTVFEGRINV